MKENSNQVPRRSAAERLLVMAGSLALAVPVFAQEASSYEGIEEAPAVNHYQFGVGGGYRSQADISGGGKFSEAGIRASAAGLFQLNDQFKLGGFLSYQYNHYDFSELPVDPWTDIHTVRFTTLLQYAIDDKWSVFGGPSLAFSGEEGADFGQAFTGGGLVGFNYRASDKLSVGGGLGAFSQLEENAKVLPFITANWDFADKWNLRAGFTDVAGDGGLGAEVTYALTDQWKVGGGIMYEKKRFRLSKNGVGDGGIGQDRNVPVYGKITWQPCKEGMIEAVAGVVVGGQLRAEDSEGNEIRQNSYGSAAVIGLRGIYKF